MSDFLITKATNEEDIRQILFNKDIKDYLILSKIEVKEDIPLLNKGIIFYILKYKGENAGIAAFLPMSDNYHAVDIGFLTRFRGK
jgi:hypothetical protein